MDSDTRAGPLDVLFKKWDLDGDGHLDMQEVRQVLDVLHKGHSKSEKKFILKFMAQLRYKYEDPNVAPLSPAEFRELMSGLTAEFADDEFDTFVASVEAAILELAPPEGHKPRDVALDALFKKWDLDGNGVVDMQEVREVLEALHKGQSKSEKKFILKFMAQLRYKYDDPNVAPLSPAEFRVLMSGLTAEFADDEFETFIVSVEAAILELAPTGAPTGQLQRIGSKKFGALIAKGVLGATSAMKPFVCQTWTIAVGSVGEKAVLSNLSFEADGSCAVNYAVGGCTVEKSVGRWLIEGDEGVITYGPRVVLSDEEMAAAEAAGLVPSADGPEAGTVAKYTVDQLKAVHATCATLVVLAAAPECHQSREVALDVLFNKWDLDGDGLVDMQEVREVLEALLKGQSKSERKFFLKFMAQLRYKYEDPNVAPLSPAEFRVLMSGLTAEFADDEFDTFIASVEAAILDLATKLIVTVKGFRELDLRCGTAADVILTCGLKTFKTKVSDEAITFIIVDPATAELKIEVAPSDQELIAVATAFVLLRTLEKGKHELWCKLDKTGEVCLVLTAVNFERLPVEPFTKKDTSSPNEKRVPAPAPQNDPGSPEASPQSKKASTKSASPPAKKASKPVPEGEAAQNDSGTPEKKAFTKSMSRKPVTEGEAAPLEPWKSPLAKKSSKPVPKEEVVETARFAETAPPVVRKKVISPKKVVPSPPEEVFYDNDISWNVNPEPPPWCVWGEAENPDPPPMIHPKYVGGEALSEALLVMWSVYGHPFHVRAGLTLEGDSIGTWGVQDDVGVTFLYERAKGVLRVQRMSSNNKSAFPMETVFSDIPSDAAVYVFAAVTGETPPILCHHFISNPTTLLSLHATNTQLFDVIQECHREVGIPRESPTKTTSYGDFTALKKLLTTCRTENESLRLSMARVTEWREGGGREASHETLRQKDKELLEAQAINKSLRLVQRGNAKAMLVTREKAPEAIQMLYELQMQEEKDRMETYMAKVQRDIDRNRKLCDAVTSLVEAAEMEAPDPEVSKAIAEVERLHRRMEEIAGDMEPMKSKVAVMKKVQHSDVNRRERTKTEHAELVAHLTHQCESIQNKISRKSSFLAVAVAVPPPAVKKKRPRLLRAERRADVTGLWALRGLHARLLLRRRRQPRGWGGDGIFSKTRGRSVGGYERGADAERHAMVGPIASVRWVRFRRRNRQNRKLFLFHCAVLDRCERFGAALYRRRRHKECARHAEPERGHRIECHGNVLERHPWDVSGGHGHGGEHHRRVGLRSRRHMRSRNSLPNSARQPVPSPPRPGCVLTWAGARDADAGTVEQARDGAATVHTWVPERWLLGHPAPPRPPHARARQQVHRVRNVGRLRKGLPNVRCERVGDWGGDEGPEWGPVVRGLDREHPEGVGETAVLGKLTLSSANYSLNFERKFSSSAFHSSFT